MIVIDQLEQGSEQWLAVRKGRATASEFSKILTAGGKLSKQSIAYMRKLARECVCDDPQEFQGNKFTDWGNDMEPEAREWFTQNVNENVREVGFCAADGGKPIGCSPDGLIVDPKSGEYVAGLEIKCPQVDTHVGYVLDGELPSAYKLQVHGSMAVTGLPRWWFISYFPGLNPLVLCVERDEFTEIVAGALDGFLIDYAKERARVLKAIIPKPETEADAIESELVI